MGAGSVPVASADEHPAVADSENTANIKKYGRISG